MIDVAVVCLVVTVSPSSFFLWLIPHRDINAQDMQLLLSKVDWALCSNVVIWEVRNEDQYPVAVKYCVLLIKYAFTLDLHLDDRNAKPGNRQLERVHIRSNASHIFIKPTQRSIKDITLLLLLILLLRIPNNLPQTLRTLHHLLPLLATKL